MDGYLSFFALGMAVITGALMYWLIRRGTSPMQARLENRCIHCGYNLVATPDRCPECGADVDHDDYIAGELDAHLLEDEWLEAPMKQRIPEFSEEAIPIHTTQKMAEATLLQEQLASRGYACRLKSATFKETYTGMSIPRPTYTVEVYTDDLAAARQYVRSLRRAVRLKHSAMQ